MSTPVPDLKVIDDPQVALAAIDPIRSQILAALRTPGSASSIAKGLDMSRQKVNYHLRTLEECGLVELVEERPRRGLTERIMIASASSYAVAPEALGDSASAPETMDRLSSQYLIAVAARIVGDVGQLARSAARAGRPLSTLTIDTEIRFANAADRAEYSRELADAIANLGARYHNEDAPNGRWHRVIVAAHPRRNTPRKGHRND